MNVAPISLPAFAAVPKMTGGKDDGGSRVSCRMPPDLQVHQESVKSVCISTLILSILL